MNRRLAVLLLLLVPSFLAAQYAETVVPIVRAEQLTRDAALWLAGSVAGSIPVGTAVSQAPELLDRLAPHALLRLAPDEPVTAGQFAHLLLRLEETPPGFWYALIPTPFTAYEQLRSLGLLDAGIGSTTRLNGSQAVAIARRYIRYAEQVNTTGDEL